jgi:hypothetical protein
MALTVILVWDFEARTNAGAASANAAAVGARVAGARATAALVAAGVEFMSFETPYELDAVEDALAQVLADPIGRNFIDEDPSYLDYRDPQARRNFMKNLSTEVLKAVDKTEGDNVIPFPRPPEPWDL